MINKKILIFLTSSLLLISILGHSTIGTDTSLEKENLDDSLGNNTDSYGIQWEMNYGDDWNEGARYEGPQPIGDCDGDGDNELLISGRDAAIRVMEWSESEQTYIETHTLHSPFYKIMMFLNRYNESIEPPDAGGMAIGDLTGDGKNEIAATWYSCVYKWIGGKYRIIGFNPYIFRNGGGSADCYIGDCDNDGQNELIMSGGPTWHGNEDMAEIVIFKWMDGG